MWVARRAADFRTAFGFAAQYELVDSEPGTPDMLGGAPSFVDGGDAVLLRDAGGAVRDALVYGTGPSVITGWIGAPVIPYDVYPYNAPHPVIVR